MQTRFSQLAVGQRFEWRGEIYIKHNTLIAHHGSSGKQQFIPRSDMVGLIDERPAAPPPSETSPLERSQVLHAFDTFHAEALHCLETMATGEADIDAARMRLAQAREHFLAALEA